MEHNYEIARQYRDFQIDVATYGELAGENVQFLSLDHLVPVGPSHVIEAIRKFLLEEISMEQLVKWVNVIWFSDAYEFEESFTDSMVSVLDQLECLDEDGVSFTEEQYQMMMDCLANNRLFPCLFT